MGRLFSDQEKTDIAFRVIADHIRALSFAIADGIIPSNEGRGYVLRRILRRAVRYGRALGFHQPFFFKLVDVVVRTLGDIFPELQGKQHVVTDAVRREEEAFGRTLDQGIEEFERMLSALTADIPKVVPLGGWVIMPGRFVFKLYDTYGFPVDLTELMARERGFAIDVEGFEKLMEEQRERGRKAQKKEPISVETDNLRVAPTKFLGYDFVEAEAVVENVLPGKKPGELNIVFDQSPFYAEMGGQVGDHGLLHVPGHDRTEVGHLRVLDTQARSNVFVHRAILVDGRAPEPGEAVRVSVDVERRHAIERHHTVTHILHWALHQIVSPEARQKGSYVGPDKLTFDFSSAPLTKKQVRAVERLVNERITENAPVSWTEIPYAEAKKRSDIQQFFGEKYGDLVRVVQIGGEVKALNGYSMELCGGTHVRATGETGCFKIVSESAMAAGIRRIEAVAGEKVRKWAEQQAARQEEKFEMLARKKTSIAQLPAFEKSDKTAAVLNSIDERATHLKKVETEVHDWEKQRAKGAEVELRRRAAEIATALATSSSEKDFCVAEIPNGDAGLLQAVVDLLKSRISGPVFLASSSNGRVDLVAAVPKELTSKIQANDLIRQVAPLVDGKGGGRPESARGAGKDASKLADALAKARELIAAAAPH